MSLGEWAAGTGDRGAPHCGSTTISGASPLREYHHCSMSCQRAWLMKAREKQQLRNLAEWQWDIQWHSPRSQHTRMKSPITAISATATKYWSWRPWPSLSSLLGSRPLPLCYLIQSRSVSQNPSRRSPPFKTQNSCILLRVVLGGLSLFLSNYLRKLGLVKKKRKKQTNSWNVSPHHCLYAQMDLQILRIHLSD